MKKKELVKNPSEFSFTPAKKPSKWGFLTRLFKRSTKSPKNPKKRSKSKDSKADLPSQSKNDSVRKDDFSSFIQNYGHSTPLQHIEKIRDDSPPETSNRPSKGPTENQNPISKIFESGGFITPDKKFLKKFTGMIDIKELSCFEKEKELALENSNNDFHRPKKPLDSTRNKLGGLKYRNNLEKFQTNIQRRFSFSYREKSVGEILFNINFFREIINYLSIDSLLNFLNVSRKFHSTEYHYQKLIRKRLVFLVTKGLVRNTVIEKDEQYIFWDNFIHFRVFEKGVFKKKFQVLDRFISKKCGFEREIGMDLDRTFPDLDFFRDEKNKECLHIILRAISNSHPCIGYTQGINAWVGILIISGLREHEAFWMIGFLLNKMDLKSLVGPGFPKIHILNYQLEIYLKVHMKETFEKLNSLGLSLSYFTTQWFMTLFTYDLPINTVGAFFIHIGKAEFN